MVHKDLTGSGTPARFLCITMGFSDRDVAPGDISTSSDNGIGSGKFARSRSPTLGLGNGNLPPLSSKGDDKSKVSSDIRKEVAKALGEEILPISEKITNSVKGSLQSVCEEACKATIAPVVARVGNLEQGQTRLEAGQARMEASLSSLIARMDEPRPAPAPSSSPQLDMGVTTPSFYRKLDPTMLFCNTLARTDVDIKKFYEAIVKLALEANIGEEHFDLKGDPLDHLFEIQFKGDTATVKAEQFYKSLQLGRGKWKEMLVLNPLDQPVQFYIQPDKNKAQIKKEILAKALKNILEPLCGGKELFVKKATGSVMVDRRVLATVSIVDEHNAKIVWFHPKRIQYGIVQEDVEVQFSLIAGGPSSS